jgi:hypothetical protein
MKDRNLNIRNFGLKSRDLARALTTASHLAANGFNTNGQAKNKCKEFARFLKDKFGIKDLRFVTKSHVFSYSQHLLSRYESGEVGLSRIHNALSTINVALAEARRDQLCRVKPSVDAYFPKRSGIATHDRSISEERHASIINEVPARLAIQLELQRAFGLRFKESCLINPKQSLADYDGWKEVFPIKFGTKGGRPRFLGRISESQREILNKAIAIQGDEESLVPRELSWRQYQNQCYEISKKLNINFHGNRHFFANKYYEFAMGVKSPIQSNINHKHRFKYISEKLGISIDEARLRDLKVRMEIAEYLGHSRVSITNSYLG